MTVGKAIFYLLDNSTDLTAIVGTRIYPEVAQQDAPLPYVVYNISNNEPSDTKREPSKMDTANIEVNCYSTSYTQVIDMSVAVRAALDRVTGTYSGVNVQSIAYMNEVIDFDEGQRAYNVSSDYDVRISRTDFEIAQGSPITGVDLGDLADVNTTGVTDGQVIAYDAATAVWLPATDAGGAEQLNDLSDVIISQPAQGEFFRYDGSEWVNDTANKSDVGLANVDNTSDANKPISTDTQTALDLKADITSVPTELDDLNDVQIIGTPTLGQALVYGAGKWLPGAAGATDLGDLDDVNTTGAAFGSLLTYNGASWDISASELPADSIYFHQRYETESEALRTGATATTELYFTCTAQGNGLAESASSDTPTAGKIIKRKIYYSEEGFADPDTGTWVEFTPAPADDAAFATVKAALLENLKARTGGTVPISLKQTWEEVAAAPTFTGLLNETYGSGAAAAYSTRRINGNYSGACMTIRRASDGTTQTIGFVGEEIDESAITTFCTGTSCTVQIWHDQSQTGGTGSGKDAEQTTPAEQPTIYTGGALVKENGRVAAEFINNSMTISGNLFSGTTPRAFFITGYTMNAPNSAEAVFSPVSLGGGNGTGYAITSEIGLRVGQYALWDASFQNTNIQLLTNIWTSGDALDALMYLDGAALSTSAGNSTVALNTETNTTYKLGVPSGNPSYRTDMVLSEMIIYSDNRTNQRASIEENVGDYFTQNTPLLDTYSGAAAAYSLRLLDSTYTGSAIRVRRSSDNTEQDIGFNVFSELDTVSLLAFAGTGDAFVKVWYCQSGNSNDATQTVTTEQPQIVSSGAVIVDANGKPAVEFDGTGDFLQKASPAGFSGKSQSSFNIVTNETLVNIDGRFFYSLGDVTLSAGQLRSVTQEPYLRFQATVQDYNSYHTSGNQELYSLVCPSATTINDYDLYRDGSLLTPDSLNGGTVADINASFLTIGFLQGGTTANTFKGKQQELILYNSNKSANRTGIETNIATFYGITL